MVGGATYHFALKVLDEAGNTSGLSNSTSALAKADTSPPGVVTDLAAVPGTETGIVDLTWTAPNEDGLSGGSVTSYDIRYSTDGPLTSANWVGAIKVPSEAIPGEPGAAESMMVLGLSPGVTHYFGLKSSDNVGNWSPVSNSPSATPADTPPPDNVIIKRAEYRASKGELRIEATSDNPEAVLTVYVTKVPLENIGTLTGNGGGKYRGKFGVDNPKNVTVKSNKGGSATADVELK